MSRRVTVTLRKPSGDIKVPALPTPVPGLFVAEDPDLVGAHVDREGLAGLAGEVTDLKLLARELAGGEPALQKLH